MLIRKQDKNGEIEHQIDLTVPIGVSAAMLTGAVIGVVQGMRGKPLSLKSIANAAKGADVAFGSAASGAFYITGHEAAKFSSRLNEKYQPKGGQSNFDERYKKMWETRRRIYGESGRGM
jgi:hypothetical protein